MVTVAMALVRAWTRLYTCRMHPALRDARRSEIDSDLWELQHDERRRGDRANAVAAQMLGRLVLGIQDDLLWRLEHAGAGRPLRRSAWVFGTAAALFAAAFWMLSVLGDPNIPPPPLPPSLMHFHQAPPPPPPPPPPLDARTTQAR